MAGMITDGSNLDNCRTSCGMLSGNDLAYRSSTWKLRLGGVLIRTDPLNIISMRTTVCLRLFSQLRQYPCYDTRAHPLAPSRMAKPEALVHAIGESARQFTFTPRVPGMQHLQPLRQAGVPVRRCFVVELRPVAQKRVCRRLRSLASTKRWPRTSVCGVIERGAPAWPPSTSSRLTPTSSTPDFVAGERRVDDLIRTTRRCSPPSSALVAH